MNNKVVDVVDIEALVRQVVTRTLGGQHRPIVDEAALRQAPAGTIYPVPAGAIITPLARQVALERQITLAEPTRQPAPLPPTSRLVAIAADHGGYALKEQLKPAIVAAGYQITDCGTHSSEAVDYPDLAYAAAQLVASGRAWRAIILDGAGIGSCMTANKVPGIRAAMCYDQATAINSREHNDANVLTLGAGLIGPTLARQIVESWLATDFGGGRHGRRVDKIMAVEKRFMKS